MKLALLADIHSNLEALNACLADAEAQGAEGFAFLGDLVGYGADPAAVLDVVMARAAAGALVVMGNHDQAALGKGSAPMNDNARRAIDWTRTQLRPDHVAFLEGLPLTARAGECLFVHASAEAPERWTYVTDPLRAAHSMGASDATYTFCGHVHEPRLYFEGADGRPQPFAPTSAAPIPVPAHRRWLAIAGSCGQPRDGKTAACYALLDDGRRSLTFHRLPYDHEQAARKIRHAGLPERLAARIERGE